MDAAPIIGGQDPFAPSADFIQAVMGRESSGGKNKATGKAGELGPLQIRPETAAKYGYTVAQLRDPEVAKQAGIAHLGSLLKKYKGNKFLALVAYNSGEGRVDKGQLLPQSVKYATGILQSMKKPGAQPQPGAQPTGAETQTQGTPLPPWSTAATTATPPAMPNFTSQQGWMDRRQTEEIPQQPSLLGRIGSAVGGALEGTAHAEELPPLPSGLKPSATPESGAPADPAGQAVAPQPQLPALPSGHKPMFDPSQFKESISISPSGPRISFQQQTPTTAERQQIDAASIAINQLSDAANFYEQKIAPKESQFTGSGASASGLRGFMQGPEYTHSRYTSLLGLHGDPDVQDFYSKIGPLQAETLKGYIGGRIGIAMAQYLGPHIPNPQTDDLPTIRRKVADMRNNLPIVLQTLKGLAQRGAGEDETVQTLQRLPWRSVGVPTSSGSSAPPSFSPDEQELIQKYGQ